MISPKDFLTSNRAPDLALEAAKRQERIEDRIDDHLAKGQLQINGGRSGWLLTDMDAVAERYRAAGWVVIRGAAGEPDFTFFMPAVVG